MIHVVQHTSAEYLGLIEDHLEGRGIRFHYCRPFTGKVPLPKPDAIDDGLILLGGGPWGSAGSRNVPTLDAEVALARACLSRGIPIVGIGLGAQILAIAAGGRSQAATFEFSISKATRMSDTALNGYLPETYPLVSYMRDWPVPPPEATVIARDEQGRAALWQLGAQAFGFAGHPGIKVAMVEDLIMEFEESPADAGIKLQELKRVQSTIEDALVPIMTGLVQCTGWMERRPP